ncbi:MAG: hypothetical protein ABEI77_05060 [Halorientalis sp.]
MQRELPLVGGFVAVVVIALLVAAGVPGVIARPEPEQHGYLQLRDIAVSHGTVSAETVPLSVEARVQHGGGPDENVTVLFRAVGLESGLVERTDTVDVGRIEGDREVPVTTTLTVNRTGGYRIETVVYRDGERQSDGSTTVEGVGNLIPAYRQSTVDFHRFAGGPNALPVIEYSIQSTTDQRTTLNVSTYLTNEGDAPSEDVRLVVKARQADSNILAAEKMIRVGQIPVRRDRDSPHDADRPCRLQLLSRCRPLEGRHGTHDRSLGGQSRSHRDDFGQPDATDGRTASQRLPAGHRRQFGRGANARHTRVLWWRSRFRPGPGGTRYPGRTVRPRSRRCVPMTETDTDTTAESESMSMDRTPSTLAEDDDGLVGKEATTYLYWGAFGTLLLLALIATVRFYLSASNAISQWVAPAYVSAFQAVFNLAVVLACGVGLSLLVRRMSE